jgi:hypothetical protein
MSGHIYIGVLFLHQSCHPPDEDIEHSQNSRHLVICPYPVVPVTTVVLSLIMDSFVHRTSWNHTGFSFP